MNFYQRMGILPLKKRVNRDKCSFTTKQRMFGVFAIDEPRPSVRALYATLITADIQFYIFLSGPSHGLILLCVLCFGWYCAMCIQLVLYAHIVLCFWKERSRHYVLFVCREFKSHVLTLATSLSRGALCVAQQVAEDPFTRHLWCVVHWVRKRLNKSRDWFTLIVMSGDR